MKITVENKRKSVVVLDFGSSPFSIDADGKIVPHGFTVRTKVNKKSWLAMTRVLAPDFIAEYRFICEDNPIDGTGDWFTTPTAAFHDVNGPKKLNDLRFHVGTNGALLIGVKYPRLQEEIANRFRDQLVDFQSSTTHKRMRLSLDYETQSQVDECILDNMSLFDDLSPLCPTSILDEIEPSPVVVMTPAVSMSIPECSIEVEEEKAMMPMMMTTTTTTKELFNDEVSIDNLLQLDFDPADIVGEDSNFGCCCRQ